MHLSIAQTVISIAALIGITILGLQGAISGDALIAVYSTVLGGAIGYINGKSVSKDNSQ